MLLLFVLLIIASCGTEQESQQEQPEVSNGESEETVETNDTEKQTTDGNAEEATTNALPVVTETGIYNGQMDPHTIQIESESGINAYQLSENSLQQIELLEEEDYVTFTYIENENNQLVLQTIEKAENSSEESETLTETGVYIGQVDPHTVEVKINGESKAFQLSNEAQQNIENLSENQEITFHYYKNGEQLIITHIQSIQ
jgi:hypothetical protein